MGKIPPTKGKKDATTMPRSSQPQKPTGGKSALDIVKADIRKKYGKGAIMGEEKTELDELNLKNIKLPNLSNILRKLNRNPDVKIPAGKNLSIPSGAGRMKQVDPEGVFK